MDDRTPAPDPYAPPRAARAGVDAPTAPLEGLEAQRRAYAGTERALAVFGVFFGCIGTLMGLIVAAGAAFLGGVHGVRATISVVLACLTLSLLAAGAFAVARLHGFGRVLLVASLAMGAGHAAFDVVSGEATRTTSALAWLVVWMLLLAWLWTGRPRVVLAPSYRAVIRATSHLERKTSIVAWLALAGLMLMIFVAVWNFFAGGPTPR